MVAFKKQDPNNPIPKKKPTTIEEIKSALIKYKGLQYLAADALGIDGGTLSERIKKNPELQELRDSLMEKRLDVAEHNLAELTENHDLGAICFLLKTKGKSRGYTEKVEIDNTQTEEIQVRISGIKNLNG